MSFGLGLGLVFVLVSDIAVFVLKGDVKLQPNKQPSFCAFI